MEQDHEKVEQLEQGRILLTLSRWNKTQKKWNKRSASHPVLFHLVPLIQSTGPTSSSSQSSVRLHWLRLPKV